MALVSNIKTESELNNIKKVVELLSTDSSFDENWKKISEESFDNLLKIIRKKERTIQKRPKTAYTMFTSDKDVQKEVKNGETLTVGQVSKKMSSKWETLTEDEKNKYAELAKKYNDENPIESTRPTKKKMTKNKYHMFLKDVDFREKVNQENGGNLSTTELQKIFISKYKTLTKEQLAHYDKLAKEENEKSKVDKVEDKEEEKEKVKEEVKEIEKEEVIEEEKQEVKE